MITKFRIFENEVEDEDDEWISIPLDVDPQIGDCVICKPDDISWITGYKEIKKFFSENMGIVISFNGDSISSYEVEYFPETKEDKKIFDDFKHTVGYASDNKSNMINFEVDEIKFWSDNKEELELKLKARKYNL